MKKDLRILVLEDAAADVVLMDRALRSGGLACETKRVETRDEFLRELEHRPPDVILSDHGLPGFDGFAALAVARERCPETPFIFVTGSMGEELAIDSLRSGASDYVLKTRLANLVPAVQRALQLAHERSRRQRAEQELRESRERFQWVELCPDAVVGIDHHGTIRDWNPAAERILGCRRDEAVGQRIDAFLPSLEPDKGRRGAADALSAALAALSGRSSEVLARRAEETFPVELAVVPIPATHPPQFTAFIRDITRRKEAEQAARQGEARRAAVIATAFDGIVSIDRDGKILDWNPAAERIFGYSRAFALGHTLPDLIAPTASPETLRQAFGRLLQGGRGRTPGHRAEIAAQRANGAEFPAEFAVARVPGEGSAGFTVFVRDITEQRRTEDALRQGEERYRSLVEGIEAYAIFLLDPHGRIATWNAGAERITGFRTSEVVGRRFHRFFPPEDLQRKKPDQALAVATADGQFHDERWLLRKNGPSWWAVLALTALRDHTGRLRGFSAIAQDLTARKQAEDDARRRHAELEQGFQQRSAELQAAHQEMEAFAYSVSHDLRAPLIHIAGFADMLKADLGEAIDDVSRRHLDTICEAAETMGRMITDLLAFSRIGRAEMHPTRFNMGDVVADVRRELVIQTPRPITWGIEELPDVTGDPILLRQAWAHLLANAVKFTGPRPEPRIEVRVETNEREHIFAVRDNGVGFDMRYAARLFGVFQRLHSAEAFEGTGVGLANVRRIVGRHGGRTWAEGEPDRGATFYFSLPRTSAPPA